MSTANDTPIGIGGSEIEDPFEKLCDGEERPGTISADNIDGEHRRLIIQKNAQLDTVSRKLADVESRLLDADAKLGSTEYELGKLIVDAIRQPGFRTLKLPYDLLRLWRFRSNAVNQHGNVPILDGRDGTGPTTVIGTRLGQRNAAQQNADSAVLFIPTNGTGLGHLTRCLAVAEELRKTSPHTQVFFLTTSVALPILFSRGFLAYHIPPRSKHNNLIPMERWQNLFASVLEQAIQIHTPSAIVFDGTFPFEGLRRILPRYPAAKSIWIKRGLNENSELIEKTRGFAALFHQVIEPKELGEPGASYSAQEMTGVPPIVYNPRDLLLTREESCDALGLDPDRHTIYVQLGAGNINDTGSLTQKVVNALNTLFPDAQVVLAASPISRAQSRITGKYTLLRDFPNSIYFDAFDLAILAAGYNSVNETIYAALPAIFFPNTETKADDQMRRAQVAARSSSVRVMESFDQIRFGEAVKSLLELPKIREHYEPPFSNGAEIAARLILEVSRSGIQASA